MIAAALTLLTTVTHAQIATPPNFKVAFIGDSDDGAAFRNVLQLIKDEGDVDLVLHQGDFSYASGPTAAWLDAINSILGPDFPYLGSDGNHDSWGQYTQFFKDRLSSMGLDPDDLSGDTYTVVYQGLKLVFSREGGDLSFVENALAGDKHIWKICSWHKNQAAMQIGGKGNAQGWGDYEACRRNGAIIATGHEHSYERTRTLSSAINQTVDVTCSDRNSVCVSPGRTFVFVSGLAGRGIRDQERCLPFTFPYGCNGEWASIYTSDQGAEFGVLFIEFHVGGDPNKANAEFKNIGGEIIDSFVVTAGDATPPTILPLGLEVTG